MVEAERWTFYSVHIYPEYLSGTYPLPLFFILPNYNKTRDITDIYIYIYIRRAMTARMLKTNKIICKNVINCNK